MTEMKKYMKIVRHGKSGTHLTLETGGEIVIQEKLDGANASFRLDKDDNVVAFSRNQQLDEHNTLRGFHNFTQGLDAGNLGVQAIYFGEWLVRHKLDYGENEQQFYLYDIYHTEAEEYLPFHLVKAEAKRLGLNLIPTFYEGRFQSMEHIQSFVGKSKLGEIGEGVVVKNTSYTDKHGNQQFTKIVSDEFAEKAKVKKQTIRSSKDSLDEFIDTFMTDARVEKILNKLVDEDVLEEDYGIEDMGVILKNSASRIYEDIIEEELDTLLKKLKGKVGKRYPVMVKQVLAGLGKA